MSLVSAGAPLAVQTSITNMPESGLIVLSIGAVILAGFLLLPPILAGRAPRQKGPASTPPWRGGPVQGGIHLGDGRSVAPHRDAPAESFDSEDITQGRAGAQATIIRDGEEVSGTGRVPTGETASETETTDESARDSTGKE